MTCKSVQLWRSRPCQSGSLLLLVTHPPAHRLVVLSGYYCPWQWGGVASCVFRYSQHGPRLTVRRLAGNGGTTWNCDRWPARGSSASLASATRAILMLYAFRPKHCTIPNIPPLVKPEIVILINNLHFQGILNVDTVLLIMEIIRLECGLGLTPWLMHVQTWFERKSRPCDNVSHSTAYQASSAYPKS